MKRGAELCKRLAGFERYSLSRSLTVTFSDGERTLGISPLYSPRTDGASFIFEQKDGSCAYVAYSKHLTATLKCSIHPSEDVFRFQLKCDGAGDTEALFSFVPMIERSGDFFAHVSFSKLFIDREYDDGNRLLLFGRRKRDGSEGLFCAVRLISGAPPECADAKDGSRCTLRIKLERGQAETVLISVSKTRDEAVRAVPCRRGRCAASKEPHVRRAGGLRSYRRRILSPMRRTGVFPARQTDTLALRDIGRLYADNSFVCRGKSRAAQRLPACFPEPVGTRDKDGAAHNHRGGRPVSPPA